VEPSAVRDVVERALEGRWLLDHPFYRRWSAGELGVEELQAYAGQYRSFEAAVPELVSTVADATMVDAARDQLSLILADEVGRPGGRPSHLELFDDFAAALGADRDAPPSPAMQRLIGTHRELAATDPVAGLAGLLAYETQSAEIARTKTAGLRRYYGLDDPGVAFWELHASVDGDHAQWGLVALAAMATDPLSIAGGLERVADAWWAFLDERQDEAPAQISA
jgi:pyrroloquinoline quinone (PQQ) biosynthesis protein C